MKNTLLLSAMNGIFLACVPTLCAADDLDTIELLRYLRGNDTTSIRSAVRSRSSPAPSRYSSNGDVGPRPRRWCGWWMRTQLGGGRQFNVAWNWRKYGRPTRPRVGAVVVWRHHVGIITGRAANGKWIIKSGNDGGRVRERPRSVAGALFRI